MKSDYERKLDEAFPFAKDADKRFRPPTENLTCMKQVNDISRLFGAIMRQKELSEHLNDSYRPLLMHLFHCDGCTQLDLVKATKLRAPTVSVTLAKMEKDGLVTRETDDYDLRARRVHITDKGRMIQDSMKSGISHIESVVMDGISDEEAAETLKVLEKMNDNLREFYRIKQ